MALARPLVKARAALSTALSPPSPSPSAAHCPRRARARARRSPHFPPAAAPPGRLAGWPAGRLVGWSRALCALRAQGLLSRHTAECALAVCEALAQAYAAQLPADNQLLLSVALTRLLQVGGGQLGAAAHLLRFTHDCGYALSELAAALDKYVAALAAGAQPTSTSGSGGGGGGGSVRRGSAAVAAGVRRRAPASAAHAAACAASLEEVCAQLSVAFSSRGTVDYTLRLCCTALVASEHDAERGGGQPPLALPSLALLRCWLPHCRQHLRAAQLVTLSRSLCSLVASSPSAAVSTAAEAVLGTMLQASRVAPRYAASRRVTPRYAASRERARSRACARRWFSPTPSPPPLPCPAPAPARPFASATRAGGIERGADRPF